MQVDGICLEYNLCKFQAWQIYINGNNGNYCYRLKSNLRKHYPESKVEIINTKVTKENINKLIAKAEDTVQDVADTFGIG